MGDWVGNWVGCVFTRVFARVLARVRVVYSATRLPLEELFYAVFMPSAFTTARCDGRTPRLLTPALLASLFLPLVGVGVCL